MSHFMQDISFGKHILRMAALENVNLTTQPKKTRRKKEILVQNLSHVNSLYAHEWEKNVTVSIIYVFEQ